MPQIPSIEYPKVQAVFVVILLSVTLACGSGNGPVRTGDGLGSVWRVWQKIDENHANRENLDLDGVVSSALREMLDLADSAPYPFLTEIGRLRGQVPPEVPGEMSDLWRAFVLHQQRWPEIEEDDLVAAAIDGLIGGLGDPATVYLSAEDYQVRREGMEEDLKGSYVGIGAQVVEQDGQILLYPMEGEPAARFGVEAGDVLLAVDGEPVAGRSLGEIVSQVKGEEGIAQGTKIALRVGRLGELEPVDLEVFRDAVDRPSVSRQLVPGGIGYVYVSTFRDNTGAQVFEALEDLSRIDMLALILDLRSTRGGSAQGATDVAGQFLAPGSLFIFTVDRQGIRKDLVVGDNLERVDLEDLPMVVLVDRETTGEAEALAGVLQETGRAVLIGTETSGAGGIYDFVDLDTGGAIYMPIARWYTSSGYSMGEDGLEPDIQVPSQVAVEGLTQDSQFNRAYEYLNDQLPAFR